MKNAVRDEQRIEHIWRCILRIKDVMATTSRQDFPRNESVQESLFYNLMILGEASSRLSEKNRGQAPFFIP